ncbi:MAG: acdA 3, partial [Ramlibacter sp.]|nr:acdA 3 [Ramlibacter sp.]
MNYSHEHLEIQKTLKRFITEEINPHVDEWEEAEIFPAHQVFKRLGELGGSEELKREFLAPAIAGTAVACIGVSEPGAGSDVSAIKSRARKDGDDYVITGQKMWITNSLQADWMCMLVNTGEGPVHKNKSLVIVPMRENGKLRPGIEVARKIRKIGMNSSDTGLIYFDEVRVPQRYRIGAEGQGFIYQMQQFQEERLWAAASCLQSLTNCIQWTIDWAQERKLFGAALA